MDLESDENDVSDDESVLDDGVDENYFGRFSQFLFVRELRKLNEHYTSDAETSLRELFYCNYASIDIAQLSVSSVMYSAPVRRLLYEFGCPSQVMPRSAMSRVLQLPESSILSTLEDLVDHGMDVAAVSPNVASSLETVVTQTSLGIPGIFVLTGYGVPADRIGNHHGENALLEFAIEHEIHSLIGTLCPDYTDTLGKAKKNADANDSKVQADESRECCLAYGCCCILKKYSYNFGYGQANLGSFSRCYRSCAALFSPCTVAPAIVSLELWDFLFCPQSEYTCVSTLCSIFYARPIVGSQSNSDRRYVDSETSCCFHVHRIFCRRY